MNSCFQNLSKIEFVVTDACTGKCKHCSQGAHSPRGASIDPTLAADTVKKVASLFPIQTVLTFGGEPLLYPEAVFAIQKAAAEMKISRRQVITNGFFSRDPKRVREVIKGLLDSGVNDLLLSVDAFHQETIPLEEVKCFAELSQKEGIPLRLQPAWLVSPEHPNPYNQKTREILDSFSSFGFPESEGNVVFPEGNAVLFLSEYFKDFVPRNPYEEDPFDLRCLSVDPDGATLGGNLYETDVLTLIKNYKPQ